MRLFRWRNYRDYGTGIAGDLFVHQFSGIHFVADALVPQQNADHNMGLGSIRVERYSKPW